MFLFAKQLTMNQAIENLRANKTINHSVRQKALALVKGYWTAHVLDRAWRLVNSLFAKEMFKREAVDSIQKNDSITPEVRQEALSLADKWPENAQLHVLVSWRVLQKPSADHADYRKALSHAEYACELDPDNSDYLTPLGLAQYRLGQYEPALETLSRADKLNSVQFKASRAEHLAFLAMTYHRLGHEEKAREMLGRLRVTMPPPGWSGSRCWQRFRHEAEELLQGPAGKLDK
jgi:tetratricopeptide (TPR) repeat protein